MECMTSPGRGRMGEIYHHVIREFRSREVEIDDSEVFRLLVEKVGQGRATNSVEYKSPEMEARSTTALVSITSLVGSAP